MSIRDEFKQFVEEASGRAHPGEPANIWAHHTAREFFDLVGALLDAGNDPEVVEVEIVKETKEIDEKMNLGPAASWLVPIVAPKMASAVVEAMLPYMGKVQLFLDEQVNPRLVLWRDTLGSIADDLSSGAE